MNLGLITGISLKQLAALSPSSGCVFIPSVIQGQSGSWGDLLALWNLLAWCHLHRAVTLPALVLTLRSFVLSLAFFRSLSSLWASAFSVLCLWSLPSIWIFPWSGARSSIICACSASWKSSLGSPIASPCPSSLGSLSTMWLCLFLRISCLSRAISCLTALGQGCASIFHCLLAKDHLFVVCMHLFVLRGLGCVGIQQKLTRANLSKHWNLS